MKTQGAASEDRITEWYAGEGLLAKRWSSDAGTFFPAHSHAQHKVLHCLRGSIVFTIVESCKAIELRPGDRLDLAAGIEHAAIVGAEGCECMEAYR